MVTMETFDLGVSFYANECGTGDISANTLVLNCECMHMHTYKVKQDNITIHSTSIIHVLLYSTQNPYRLH